jgi:pSer/pThr/pTyr-binding forkhead associated (FHA) protein
MTANDSELSKENELTSTINISALRPVRDFSLTSELLNSLSLEEKRILEELSDEDAMLIALSGPGRGSRYLLIDEVSSIGRDPKNSIFLDDITVSRSHAVIRKVLSKGVRSFEVEDSKSLNGTYLNAKSTVKTSLSQGDELQIGKFRLTFFRSLKQEIKGE